MSKELEVKHYKVLTLSGILEKNAVYYLLDQSTGKVKTFITSKDGVPIPLIDLTTIGSVLSVTGTGVSGTANNPKVDIATFVSSQLGNQVYLSLSDGKLQVNPVTSPNSSISVTTTSTELQLQLSTAITTQINTALQPGANISELTNDVGYITAGSIIGTDLAYTPSASNGIVTSNTGTDATIPLAGVSNAGLLSPQEKQDIADAVQPGDLAAVATSGDYGDLNNIPPTFTPSPHTHPISDVINLQTTLDSKVDSVTGTGIVVVNNADTENPIISVVGTKAQFNTAVTDGDFIFDSDITEAAQDAVGTILTDTSTIDFTYNDSTPSISAIVKPNSITATELSNVINISEFVNDLNYTTKTYVDALVVSIFRPAGSWDASANTFPTLGTGTAGAIRVGDTFNTTVAGTPVGFETLDIGDSFYALIDNPGQTASNWARFEANTQQATESFRGTSRIVTQAVIEDFTTTNDTDTVTAKKFYLGWEKIKTLAQTFAAKITFTTAPRFNSGTADTVPYLDSNKDLVSSTVTPTELGYVSGVTSSIQTQIDSKEDLANKSTSTSLGTSNILYPTQNAVKVYADSKVTQTITDGVTITAPSEDAVFDALLLKKDDTSTAVTSIFTLTNNGTTFTISTLQGVIVNNSTVPPTRTYINFLGAINITPLYTRTILYIDNTGTLQQFNGATGDLTPLQKRDNLFIGAIVYFGGVIVAIQKIPSISYDTDGRLETFFESVGVINRDGNIIGANGANLQIDKGAGHTQRSMGNYFIDRKIPDVTTDAAIIPIPAGVNAIGYRNGLGGWTYEAYTGSITPQFWDDGTGVKATVSNNKFTIQRIYFFNGTDTFLIYLGQSEYSSLAAAESAINNTDRVVDPATSPASLRSSLIVEKGCTALNNTTLARFVEGPRISGGNSSGSSSGSQSMQSTYDNSITPQITTTVALGSVDFRRGTAADTDAVFRIQNGIGTSTFSIAGSGAVISTGDMFVQPSSASTPAIQGTSGSGYGVGGTSTSGVGVIGTSSSTFGVQAISTTGIGLRATTVSGTKIASFMENTTERAYIANTGAIFSITATAGQSDTQLATTAFVTTADNLKANLASPALTGVPTAPTAAAGTNTTQIATTAFVTGAFVTLTTSQTITGVKVFQNTTGGSAALQSSVSGGGTVGANFTSGNSGTAAFVTGTAGSSNILYAQASGTHSGVILTLENTGTTTSKMIRGLNNAGAEIFTVSSAANVTATSFIKSGATAGNMLLAGGTDIAQSTFATATGGTGYIQNQAASAQTADMWISNNGTFGGKLRTVYADLGLESYINTTSGHAFIDSVKDDAGYNLYIRMRTNGTPINAITISGTGAATFASTVTAPTFIGALTGTASNSIKWNGLDIALSTYTSGTIASSLLYNSTNSRVEFGTAAHYLSWLGLTSAITGTGTSGFIPKWTGTGTQGNSILSESGSTITNTGQFLSSSTSTQGFYQARLSDTMGGGVFGGNSFSIRNGSTSEDLNFDVFNRVSSAWTTPMVIKNTGNVLIGTTTDDGVNELQVNGGAAISSKIKVGTVGSSIPLTLGIASDLNIFATNSNKAIYLFNNGTSIKLDAYDYGASAALDVSIGGNGGVIRLDGATRIPSLSGTGTRTVVADASGNLSAPVSDISLKENIVPIGYGLKEIMQMNPVWFTFKEEYKNYGTERQNGNIAQEMEKIIPEATFTTPSTGKMGISYEQLDAVYIKAIQEQQKLIEKLTLRIEQLENK